MEKEEIRNEAVSLISDLRKLIFSFQCFEGYAKEDLTKISLSENVSQTIENLKRAEMTFGPIEKL